MATVHSAYGLPIFIADDGEVPQKGAFFATNNKWTLSKIAKVAYNDSSAWKIINKNGGTPRISSTERIRRTALHRGVRARWL